MSSTGNLRVFYTVSTPRTASDFERLAVMRFGVLRRACRWSLTQCADELNVGLRSVARWSSGDAKVPAWVLIALELRARELGVEIARAA